MTLPDPTTHHDPEMCSSIHRLLRPDGAKRWMDEHISGSGGPAQPLTHRSVVSRASTWTRSVWAAMTDSRSL